ncbi:hypothetical protein [Rhodoferax bucti]|uniref:hypothetical protein n=1 Tax=Rhodoferax bucti TaxID=2576305 RepID=UPI0011083F23|nr:hypothetical protein [Rhodoferax bucti]
MNKSQKSAVRMLQGVLVGAAAWGGLAGCAGVEHVGWVLAGTGKPATLVVANQTLTGEMLLRPDRTGEVRVSVAAATGGTGGNAATVASGVSGMSGPGAVIASCAGSLRFSGTVQGRIDMRCSDGAMFDMAFYLINEVKGFASGTYQEKPAALVFGMHEAEAQAYLSPAMARATDATKPTP